MFLLGFSNQFHSIFSCLCLPVSILLLSHTLNHINRHSFILCHSSKHTVGNLLGLGDEQCVSEEEEVSLLGLKACLQLRLGVTQEHTAWTLSQEGLDKGTRLWADWRQAAFPWGQNQDKHRMKYSIGEKETFVAWMLWRQFCNPANSLYLPQQLLQDCHRVRY